jgi:hypothetical protein
LLLLFRRGIPAVAQATERGRRVSEQGTISTETSGATFRDAIVAVVSRVAVLALRVRKEALGE